MADAANDQDRERYITALIGRLKLSGDVGLLYKEDADRLIENIPSDLDIFKYNREYATDPERAHRLLLYGAYPNIRPELREELVKEANNASLQSTEPDIQSTSDSIYGPTETADTNQPFGSIGQYNSGTNKDTAVASKDLDAPDPESSRDESSDQNDAAGQISGEQYAGQGRPRAPAQCHQNKCRGPALLVKFVDILNRAKPAGEPQMIKTSSTPQRSTTRNMAYLRKILAI